MRNRRANTKVKFDIMSRTTVPLGTAIVRILGAEPGLASVREDATRKSVAE